MTHDPRPIAFQGDLGANSHTAILQKFGDDARVLPCATFEDAFVAVESGEARLAMIPIENTLAGRVADVHHFLPKSGLRIVGEHFLPIHFHLMALPGVSEDEIREIHTHVHALGQCRRLLGEKTETRDPETGRIVMRPRWKGVTAGDTAGAAKLVAERGERWMAALAPRLAASLYGLDILREHVEDEAHNVTRFVVLSPAYAPAERLWAPQDTPGGTVTTFVFRVRNIPAALYKALGGFATNGLNMTKLESYQLGGKFFATQFYADVEGHPDDPALNRALAELRFFAEVEILGVYAAAPDRARLAAADG